MRLSHARLSLFGIWSAAFLGYLVMFFLCSTKDAVSWRQATDAAWNVSFILIPILSAFASFWFGPQIGQGVNATDESERITKDRTIALYGLTALFHLSMLTYFLFGVVFVDFSIPVAENSFSERVDIGLKFLLLFSSLALLPVGFVLKGKAPLNLVKPATPEGASGL